MEKINEKDNDFTSFPLYMLQPKSNYKKLWKTCDYRIVKNLIMTVVESPVLQLIQSDSKIPRSTASQLISSVNCSPPNHFPNLKKIRYTLDLFRAEPFPPFIPDLLLFGINEIESECHLKKDWSVYYLCEKNGDQKTCDKIVKTYMSNPGETEALQQCLTNSNITDIALCILNFLTIFEKKPLHFHSINLRKILSEPLYDAFLRPNPNIREIVKACVLKSSRTEVDTLTFTMIHILHIWEYTNLPLKTKVRLAKLFGPRLISFEDPVYLHDTEDVSSPQSAMLEAILEICDGKFWENLNYMKRREMFIMETNFERMRDSKSVPIRDRPPEFAFMCSPYSLFPNVSNSLDIYNNEKYKDSSFYRKLIKVMR